MRNGEVKEALRSFYYNEKVVYEYRGVPVLGPGGLKLVHGIPMIGLGPPLYQFKTHPIDSRVFSSSKSTNELSQALAYRLTRRY